MGRRPDMKLMDVQTICEGSTTISNTLTAVRLINVEGNPSTEEHHIKMRNARTEPIKAMERKGNNEFNQERDRDPSAGASRR